MFKSIGRFIVKVADLAEAEGRLAVRNLVLAAVAVLFAAAAVGLGMTAVVMAAVASYWAMASVMSPPAALAIAASFVFLAALGMGGMGYGIHTWRQGPIKSCDDRTDNGPPRMQMSLKERPSRHEA